jgi:hypothetical protein
MPGGFSTGFSTGFGPFAASGVISAALFSLLGLIGIKENNNMESKILSGANASGFLAGSPNIATEVQNISLGIPLDEVGTSDPTITLSGASTGAYTFHNNTAAKIRFQPNEDIYISTSGFSAEYTAVINYLLVGDMSSYMQTDPTRTQARFVPNFWRYR